MKERIEEALRQGLLEMGMPPDAPVSFSVERPREAAHGDLATNAALVSAKALKRSPRQIAGELVERLSRLELVEKVEIAGPGFINVFLSPLAWLGALADILKRGDDYGRAQEKQPGKILLEFVSANPTGPLHFGHGRGAAVGDVLANLLEWAGFEVVREYYVNDAGGQVNALVDSIIYWLKKAAGQEGEFPADGYRGDYVRQLAEQVPSELRSFLPGEPDAATRLRLRNFALERMLGQIRADLTAFGVRFDEFVFESRLVAEGRIGRVLERLGRDGYTEERDGALWFLADRFGDEKPRVLVKRDGQNTYFATDLAYHLDKLERGFDRLINIWGADHHGYIPRMRAAIAALGGRPEQLQVLLVQMVSLLRDGQPVVLSKRQGEIITLREVFEEVGADAARFFFLLRGPDSQMEFDIELAKKKSLDNPVFYAQYGHARLCSILHRAVEKGYRLPTLADVGPELLGKLTLPDEIELARRLGEFGAVIKNAAAVQAPHLLVYYLQELVGVFHGYYTKYARTQPVLVEDRQVACARLVLVQATRQVLKNAFSLLGVSAPERMEALEEEV